MKRLLTSVILSLAMLLTANAQQNPPTFENFCSYRAGVNFSSLVSDDYSSDAQTGFNIAALYNISLMKSAPLYLQTGLAMEMKGARNSGLIATTSSTHFKSYAIEIPVVATFDIPINAHAAIVPELGLFYSFAFTGSLEGGGEFFRPYKHLDLTSPEGESLNARLFHRSDFGIRTGLSFRYMNALIGFAYDAGLVNYFSKDLRDTGAKTMTGCWSVNIGYRFNHHAGR